MGQLRRIVLTYSFSTRRITGETVHTAKLAESFARLGVSVIVCVIAEGRVCELFRKAGAEVVESGRNALMRSRRDLPRFAAALVRRKRSGHSQRDGSLVSGEGAAALFDTSTSLLLWRSRFPGASAPFVLHWRSTSLARAPLGPIAARLCDALVSPGTRGLSLIAPWMNGKPACVAKQSLSWNAARALGSAPPRDSNPGPCGRTASDVVVLHCGGAAPRKRVGAAVKAVAELRDVGLPVKMMVAGAADPAAVERMLRPLPPDSRAAVRFLGWTDRVHELMLECDIYLQTSRREGISNALLEAAAAGLPIVATDVGDTRDVVHDGESGYVVSPSPRGLASRTAAALQTLVVDEAAREAYGQRGRDIVWRQHRPGREAQRLKDFIEERVLD